MEATTSNYLSIALTDDKEAEASEVQTIDKSAIRKQRIQAAVERSKTEYHPEHAYTERGSSLENDARQVADKPKIDKQRLEYLASSLYHQGNFDKALKIVMRSLDPLVKLNAGLNKELLDTGLRAALNVQDVENAVRLARFSESAWKGQSCGIAVAASDAFSLAGNDEDALKPLLVTTSSFGLHEPVLARLVTILERIEKNVPSTDIQRLISLVEAVRNRRRYNIGQPLFGEAVELPHAYEHVPAVYPDSIMLCFREDLRADLQGTLRRLERTSAAEPVPDTRGVRSL